MWQTYMELSSWLLGPLGWIAVGWFLVGLLVGSVNAIWHWKRNSPDTQALDWLEEQVVAEIYLDDGRLIDVGGNSVRTAVAKVIEFPSPESDEDDQAAFEAWNELTRFPGFVPGGER